MTAHEFNHRFPVGTKVRFYPGGIKAGQSNPSEWVDTVVQRAAFHLSSGKAVVPLKGLGAKPFTHIEVIPVPAEAYGC